MRRAGRKAEANREVVAVDRRVPQAACGAGASDHASSGTSANGISVSLTSAGYGTCDGGARRRSSPDDGRPTPCRLTATSAHGWTVGFGSQPCASAASSLQVSEKLTMDRASAPKRMPRRAPSTLSDRQRTKVSGSQREASPRFRDCFSIPAIHIRGELSPSCWNAKMADRPSCEDHVTENSRSMPTIRKGRASPTVPRDAEFATRHFTGRARCA
jgi:hypothetical protein